MRNTSGFSAIGLFAGLLVITIVVAGWNLYTQRQYSRTAPSTPTSTYKPKQVVAMGDMVCDPKQPTAPGTCQSGQVYELTKKLGPDIVLGLGDLQYNNGSLAKFQSSFAAQWGGLKNIFYPTPGNHEYATPGAAGYFSYFGEDPPKDPTIKLSPWYSFDYADWHFVSLNSNCAAVGGCGSGSAQLAWLEQDLQKNTKPCTIAFWHHPRFTSGKYAADIHNTQLAPLWEKLTAHHTSAVLNGHDHLYERFAPQKADGQPSPDGIRQFTVGTGGHSHYKQQTAAANSERVIDNEFGVLRLELFPKAFRWEFVSIAGKVLDSGRQHCTP